MLTYVASVRCELSNITDQDLSGLLASRRPDGRGDGNLCGQNEQFIQESNIINKLRQPLVTLCAPGICMSLILL